MFFFAMLILMVVPIAAVPLVGSWAGAISGLLLLVLVVASVNRYGRQWRDRLAIVLAVLGALIGAANAAIALAHVGSDPIYSTRAGFGWAALAFACLTALGALAIRSHPSVAATILAVGGIAGANAINLFSIDTYYLLAVPLWLLGALLALARAVSSRPSARVPPD